MTSKTTSIDVTIGEYLTQGTEQREFQGFESNTPQAQQDLGG